MLSNQQAQQGKEKMELLKIIGNVIGEYAKAAFANPMNTQNPDVILQKVQLEIDKMYGGGNQQQPGEPVLSGLGAEPGAEQSVPPGGQPVQSYEGESGYGGELPAGEYGVPGEYA
jgi:hypothetical protein